MVDEADAVLDFSMALVHSVCASFFRRVRADVSLFVSVCYSIAR